MARITLAPIVSDAAGKVAGLVFSRWKGRNYIRKLVTPANPQSAAQTEQRDAMARCVELWRSLRQVVKDQLDQFATGIRMSGYNWFVGQNRVPEVLYDSAKLTPHNPDVTQLSTVAFTQGAAGEIDITWVDPGDDTADTVVSYYRKVEPLSEENEIHMFGSAAIATAAQSITGLDTGELYHVFVHSCLGATEQYCESDSEELLAG